MSTRSRAAALTKAREFLDRVPLLDGHNDLPYVVREHAAAGDLAAYDLTREHQETDTDIPRLIKGKVAGQFWAAFVPSDVADPCRFTLEQIALIRRMNLRHADVFLPATRASDLARARRQGKIASYIAVESSIGLNGSLELLEIWRDLGVKYLTLCHNETLDWVDSATDAPRHGGLTAFGRDVVTTCNRLGILVDLAHTSHEVQMQVLDLTTAPVAITHANAFALVDHPRNTRDEVMARLKASGSIICATFVQTFSNQATREWVKGICDPWRGLQGQHLERGLHGA
jgi:membrane dipeptidase